ncbi:MAG: hypothetical protein D6702_01455 [Planctomycetota bacterium]|nr:MAG: hypothetical protein D6702_01455 [Planctomycetota bacterium]
MPLNAFPILLLAPLLAAACQSAPRQAPPPVLTAWPDVPVPQGFEPLETVAAKAAFQIGEFRHGELSYLGLGTVEGVEEYYRGRLPVHGWQEAPDGVWKKGPWRLTVTVTNAPKEVYEGFNKVVVTLRMRSERTPLTSR